MIKHMIAFVILFLLPVFVYPGDGCLDYSPTDMNSLWRYKWYEKKNPSNVMEFRAHIEYKQEIGGKTYYCYYSPANNLKNVTRITEDGAFIRTIKYPMPVLGFIYVDVDLNPEMQFIKCPLKVGDKWEQASTGTVKFLGIFNITRNARAKFEVIGRDTINIGGKQVEIYKLKTEIDDGSGTFKKSEQWFGKGVGYVMEDNEYYNLMLEDYSIEKIKK